MKRITAVLLMCIFSISFASCKDNAQSSSNEPGTSINTEDKSNEDIKGDEENMNTKITMTANGYSFTVALEKNQAVNELLDMMANKPLTLELSDYAGFEKVGPL